MQNLIRSSRTIPPHLLYSSLSAVEHEPDTSADITSTAQEGFQQPQYQLQQFSSNLANTSAAVAPPAYGQTINPQQEATVPYSFIFGSSNGIVWNQPFRSTAHVSAANTSFPQGFNLGQTLQLNRGNYSTGPISDQARSIPRSRAGFHTASTVPTPSTPSEPVRDSIVDPPFLGGSLKRRRSSAVPGLESPGLADATGAEKDNKVPISRQGASSITMGPMSAPVSLRALPKPGRKPMPQDTATSRRREQNRQAQRNFRDKRQQRVNELADELKALRDDMKERDCEWRKAVHEERSRRQQAEARAQNAEARVAALEGVLQERGLQMESRYPPALDVSPH